jgi:protein gp37
VAAVDVCAMSAIEWTDETWNPTVGCSRVSPGCDHCYAIGVAHRAMQPAHEGLTIKRKGEPTDWTGEVRMLPDRLDVPLRWRKPRRVFVDSMSDLFHPEVLGAMHQPANQTWPVPFLAEVFAVMASTPRHTYQVLTKRPQLMSAVLNEPRFRMDVNARLLGRGMPVMPGGFESPWPRNIWLGTSIESDRYAWRADHLRATPAAVRFLSLEPLLGPLPSLDLTGIDWVIVGGESGPGARPLDLGWVRDLIAQGHDAGAAVFVKQLGRSFDGRKGADIGTWPADLRVRETPR